ncbi:unnamed protein product, partial [Mesorhabditis spiculigera]
METLAGSRPAARRFSRGALVGAWGGRRRKKFSDSVLHAYYGPIVRPNHSPYGQPVLQGSTASTLNRRHGRSCDLHEVQAEGAEFKPLFNNPIAQVSSDILKVQGYSTQFRSLLSARLSPRRDSVPNVHIQDSNTELETKSG